MKVIIVGVTGETGSTIVNGLLESKTTKFVKRPSLPTTVCTVLLTHLVFRKFLL